jgi:hypothetical protein
VKIDTQFLLIWIIISRKLSLYGSDELVPFAGFETSEDDPVFDVLRARGTERDFGEENVEIAVKEGQVKGRHGGIGGGANCLVGGVVRRATGDGVEEVALCVEV